MINEEMQMLDHIEEAYSVAKALGDMNARHMRKTLSKIHKRLEQDPEAGRLSLWKTNASSRAELVSYVKKVTDRSSKYYIPPKDRLVVTDMDGTLFCETDPTYFDFKLLMYRVLEDEDYKDKATEQERTVVHKIQDFIDTGVLADGLEFDAGQAIASSFAGMTVPDFNQYVKNFGGTPAPGYDGMKAGEAFYKPMLQVLNYLEEHDFSVYICSGTDRLVIREIASEVNITPNRVIGTDEKLVARDQGDTKDAEYYFNDHDELVLGGQLVNKNLQMSKVAMIAKEIGQQPVLCFGNSSGDISMAKYVTTNNPHLTRVFMLCCDDTVRENGNLKKAEKMRALCEENGWVPVSMKNDWETIYGPNVTRKLGS